MTDPDPDPRVEAAAQWLAASRGDRWRDSTMREAWRTSAAEVLGGVDAVDPLRAPSRLDRVAETYATITGVTLVVSDDAERREGAEDD